MMTWSSLGRAALIAFGPRVFALGLAMALGLVTVLVVTTTARMASALASPTPQQIVTFMADAAPQRSAALSGR